MASYFDFYAHLHALSQGTPVEPTPEPETDPPIEDPEPGYIEARLANHPKHHRAARPCPDCRLAFQRWRARGGAFVDDDHAEPLTDEEAEALARHVLP